MILSALARLLRFLAGALTAVFPAGAPPSAAIPSAAAAASLATRNSLRLSVLRAISLNPRRETFGTLPRWAQIPARSAHQTPAHHSSRPPKRLAVGWWSDPDRRLRSANRVLSRGERRRLVDRAGVASQRYNDSKPGTIHEPGEEKESG